jgi:hypothetical protein
MTDLLRVVTVRSFVTGFMITDLYEQSGTLTFRNKLTERMLDHMEQYHSLQKFKTYDDRAKKRRDLDGFAFFSLPSEFPLNEQISQEVITSESKVDSSL